MKKKHIAVFTVLIVLNLAFIWGNSMLPGKTSGQISSGLLHWLKEAMPFLMSGMGEFLLRKIGHFSEFALLGLLLCRLFQLLGEMGIHRFAMPLLCGIAAAAVDETIQIVTPDRGSSLIDVWIDTAGVCTGIVCLIIGYAILQKMKGKK